MIPKLLPKEEVDSIELYFKTGGFGDKPTVFNLIFTLRQAQRKADALDKLESMTRKTPQTIYWDGAIIIIYQDRIAELITAPTLLEAIEKTSKP